MGLGMSPPISQNVTYLHHIETISLSDSKHPNTRRWLSSSRVTTRRRPSNRGRNVQAVPPERRGRQQQRVFVPAFSCEFSRRSPRGQFCGAASAAAAAAKAERPPILLASELPEPPRPVHRHPMHGASDPRKPEQSAYFQKQKT